MTLTEKLKEIETYFNYWTGNFNRKDLTTNNVRIAAESICKAVILSSENESQGTQIILGKTNLPTSNRFTRLGDPLKFYDLIQVLVELNKFKDAKDIKLHFDLIRDRTNPSSHSSNKLADNTTEADLEVCNTSIKQVINWFFKTQILCVIPYSIQNAMEGKLDVSLLSNPQEKWQEFLILCHDFEKRFQYIIVSPFKISDNVQSIEAIAKLPWRLVIDFNPQTDETENGLLYNFEKLKGTSYKKSFTIADKLDFDPKFQHYWFFADGQGSLLPIKDFKSWRSKYKRYLSETLYKAFNKGSRPKSRVVVFLNTPPNYAESIIDEFNGVDEANLKHVICSDGTYNYDNILDNFQNVNIVDISIDELAEGINNSISFNEDEKSKDQILIPHKQEGKTKGFVKILQEDYDYLKTLGIEVIYRGIERQNINPDFVNSFYKGGLSTWKDFYEGKVIGRNSFDNLYSRIQSELEKNKLQEVELVHDAGAGGTTVGRNIAYKIHNDYPTVVLRKYEPKKTIAGLRIIYDQYTKGSLPLLLIIEAYEVKDSSQLYRDLALAIKNAVILIIRRGQVATARDKKFILKAQLDLNEISVFENVFSTLMPSRRDKILSVKSDYKHIPKYISPFVYGLAAYEKDFIGIESYVIKCLENITLEQKKIAGFICLIYHFTQKSVPAELFTVILGTDRSRSDLRIILGNDNPIFELLHEDLYDDESGNYWRPRHEMLGEEAIKILLSGGVEHKENYKAYLSQWLIDLIKTIRSTMPYLDDETKLMFDSLFIHRTEYEGYIYNNKEAFTEVFNYLKNTDGEAVFTELTSAYPNDPHFHGHFARYLYNQKIGIKNYAKAIEEAELSLDILPNDSRLIHTLGMCFREKAEEAISNFDASGLSKEDIEDHVQNLVEQACENFDNCIRLDPNNVHAHDSQIRLLLKTLDFGFKIYGATAKEIFISNPKNNWYSKKLDKVSSLLEDALYVIEQAKGLEKTERVRKSEGFLMECEANFFKTLGKSLVAKDKFQNLIKNTPSGYQFMVPHYRRMYIKCLLASKDAGNIDFFNAWACLSESELNEAVEFLADNILEDADNPQNIRLWLQSVRFLKNPPGIGECISKIGTWTQTLDQNINSSLEGFYYLYVLNAISSISAGNTFDPTSVHNVKEIKDRMKFYLKNEKFCFEWYGIGIGVQKMVNHKKLGEFTINFFEKNKKYLQEVTGRVKDVVSSQQGTVILDCGLEAFFVPNVSGFTERNINNRVKFYVGFRYDQIQAWSVVLLNQNRNESLQKQEFIEIEDLIKEPIIEQEKVVAPSIIEENRIELPKIIGPKILGTIQLPDIPVKPSRKKEGSQIPPSKVYNGFIKILKQDTGYIRCVQLEKNVAFKKLHLKNIRFDNLTEGMAVSFKLVEINEIPQTDFSGRNYQSFEVFPT